MLAWSAAAHFRCSADLLANVYVIFITDFQGTDMGFPFLGPSHLVICSQVNKIDASHCVVNNVAAQFSSVASKINCGWNLLAAKYSVARLQRKMLTFLASHIYIYIYIYIPGKAVLVQDILNAICSSEQFSCMHVVFIGYKCHARSSNGWNDSYRTVFCISWSIYA